MFDDDSEIPIDPSEQAIKGFVHPVPPPPQSSSDEVDANSGEADSSSEDTDISSEENLDK